MNRRLALFRLIERYGSDEAQIGALYRLGGFEREPGNLAAVLIGLMAVIAAFLTGLGIIFWVAANWDLLGRTGQFALLQGWIVAAALGAWRFDRVRVPFCVLAFLGIGALLAYFGQTYQTGADLWQLFALWAFFALPLAFAARHDAFWIPWISVAFVAVILHPAGYFSFENRSTVGQIMPLVSCWFVMLALSLVCHPYWKRATGSTVWSLRWALLVVFAYIVVCAGVELVIDVFDERVHALLYWPAIVLLAVVVFGSSRGRLFDPFVLVVGLLAMISLIGLRAVSWMSHGHLLQKNMTLSLALITLIALGLIAVVGFLAVRLIRGARRFDAEKNDGERS